MTFRLSGEMKTFSPRLHYDLFMPYFHQNFYLGNQKKDPNADMAPGRFNNTKQALMMS